jgi:hypothetical protein
VRPFSLRQCKDTRNDGMESQNTSSSSPEEAHLLSSSVFKKMLFLVLAERVKTESGQSSKSRVARDWTAACVGDSKNLCYFPESLLAFANRSISTVLRVHKLSLDGAAEGFCFGFGLFRGWCKRPVTASASNNLRNLPTALRI